MSEKVEGKEPQQAREKTRSEKIMEALAEAAKKEAEKIASDKKQPK